MLPSQFNPLAPETVENPYPFYRAMREHAPVYQVPGAGFFIISRYADIMSALNNEEVFSSRQPPGVNTSMPPEVAEIYAQGYPPVDTLLTNDPPAHTRYRVLVTKAFSARRVATLEPKVRDIAVELVDKFARDGRVELMHQFAVGLPLTVIADALGVPREDMDKFKRWSDDSVAPLGGMISPQRQIECTRSIVEFQHYFAAKLEERRVAPRDDLLTDLLNARLEGTKPLDTGEMLSILQQLLVAGNETTTNLIGSAMMLALRHPDQMRALIDRSVAHRKLCRRGATDGIAGAGTFSHHERGRGPRRHGDSENVARGGDVCLRESRRCAVSRRRSLRHPPRQRQNAPGVRARRTFLYRRGAGETRSTNRIRGSPRAVEEHSLRVGQ